MTCVCGGDVSFGKQVKMWVKETMWQPCALQPTFPSGAVFAGQFPSPTSHRLPCTAPRCIMTYNACTHSRARMNRFRLMQKSCWTGNEKDENIDFLDHLRIPSNGGPNPTTTDHLPPRQQLSFALPHGFHHAGEYISYNFIFPVGQYEYYIRP
jgi:hypothetical protein